MGELLLALPATLASPLPDSLDTMLVLPFPTKTQVTTLLEGLKSYYAQLDKTLSARLDAARAAPDARLTDDEAALLATLLAELERQSTVLNSRARAPTVAALLPALHSTHIQPLHIRVYAALVEWQLRDAVSVTLDSTPTAKKKKRRPKMENE